MLLYRKIEVLEKFCFQYKDQFCVKDVKQEPTEHDQDDEDGHVMDNIQEKLEHMKEELDDAEALNTTLAIRERMSNDELQEARKELINVCMLRVFNFCACILFILLILNTIIQSVKKKYFG